MNNQVALTPYTIIQLDFGEFAAAHQIPNHDGKCRNLHGHNYRVHGEFGGFLNSAPGSPNEGMVVDFSIIKEIYKSEIHSYLDHSLLVGSLPLPWFNSFGLSLTDRSVFSKQMVTFGFGKVALLDNPTTTAESLAWWILHRFDKALESVREVSRFVGVISITVFETSTSSAKAQVGAKFP